MDEATFRTHILHHTKMCQQIRSKLKKMLMQLSLPEIAIERYILNYIGTPKFNFYKKIKIDTRLKSSIKMISHTELIPGKKYYIYQPSTKYLPHAFYRGTFVRKHGMLNLFDVTGIKPVEYLGELNFGTTEMYYDLDKIKENSTKAKQNMEKRALNMILKNILNEDFVWY